MVPEHLKTEFLMCNAHTCNNITQKNALKSGLLLETLVINGVWFVPLLRQGFDTAYTASTKTCIMTMTRRIEYHDITT